MAAPPNSMLLALYSLRDQALALFLENSLISAVAGTLVKTYTSLRSRRHGWGKFQNLRICNQ